MRKAIVNGRTIAIITLAMTIILYFWIDPKDNKLEKIKIEKKGEVKNEKTN